MMLSNNNLKLPISAFIITFNEENNIKECLQSLSFCQEIIIVDSGSTDETVQIATEMGAKFYYRKFTDYTEQKQFALNQCSNTWVLSLDADERITPELCNFLYTLNLENSPFNGYEFKRLHCFLGKFIKYSGLYPDYKLRFFNKNKGKFTGNKIHEIIEVEGKSKKIPFDILHYSWKDIKDYLIKQFNYAEKVAQNKASLGITSNPWFAVWHGKFAFFYRYFIRLGFLDGWQGFVLCLGAGIITCYKYLKLWELSKSSPFLNNILFKPLQIFYAIIISLRLKLYENNLLKKHKLSVETISIGNLSVGGSGKTPFVIALAKALNENNKITILTRGYKSQIKNTQIKIISTKNTAQEIGDEPLMMAKEFSEYNNISVIVCPDRIKSGQFAIDNLQTNILILDDGFQYLRLERDLNICLIDCSDIYLQNLLPCGSLREPFSQIERADFIVLTRAEHNILLKEKYLQLIKKYTNNTNIYELKESIYFTQNEKRIDLQNKKVLVFCALGNPHQFVQSLELNNIQIQKTIFYTDHFIYTEKEIKNINEQFLNCSADIVITTSKDASKLNDLNLPFPLAIANLEFTNFDDLFNKLSSSPQPLS